MQRMVCSTIRRSLAILMLPACHVQENVAEAGELQDNLQAEQAAHAAVREQAGRLKAQVAELQLVEQRYGELKVKHEETTNKLDKLEEEHLVCVRVHRQSKNTKHASKLMMQP